MTREKRSYTRITLDIPASLSLYQMETFRIQAIKNISIGGCFFLFEGELPLKEQCEITISIGEGLQTEEVTISGMVVRSDTQGVGIQFTHNSPEQKQQLEKIISGIMSGRDEARVGGGDNPLPPLSRSIHQPLFSGKHHESCLGKSVRMILFLAAAMLGGITK